MAEIQDFFREYDAEFLKTHSLSPVQIKAFRAIRDCRTATLGAHLDICDTYGFKKISYNFCRNRHYPKCQTFAKEEWIDKQNQSLLNTNYFHIVFTMPEELNPLLLRLQESTYSLFFKAVLQTLLELCSDLKYLGATPGITAVLHTWGQNLFFHPHIHCMATGGSLTKDQNWRSSRQKFFLPVKILSRKFRGKFLAFLCQAGRAYPDTIQNASKGLDYLGRYAHRVAISNNRILRFRDGQVTSFWGRIIRIITKRGL